MRRLRTSSPPAPRPRSLAPFAATPFLAACCLLAVLALSVGCDRAGGGSEKASAGGWLRTDLTWLEPAVDMATFEAPERGIFRREVGFLGAEEVRDLSRVPEAFLANHPRQSGAQVRVVRQAAGSRISWKVDLGADPFLVFTPFPGGEPMEAGGGSGAKQQDGRGADCRQATFRVGVRTPDAAEELYKQTVTASKLAPMEVRLDLAGWAGTADQPRPVEVLFHVDPVRRGGAGAAEPVAGENAQACWVQWLSPSVYSRGPRPVEPDEETRPNVILVGFDTLRADYVGAFQPQPRQAWAPPSLTPAIDRLAEDSDVFLSAHATFNATNPSFASILTGLYGKNHKIYDLRTPLPPAHDTLPELFRDAGYETLAVITAHHLGDHNSGLGQGFDKVVLADRQDAAEKAVAAAMDWIAEREGPFFVWLHLFDPHTPHTPPAPFSLGLRPTIPTGMAAPPGWTTFREPGTVEEFSQPVLAGHNDLYSGEVAYLDHQIDRLLGFLESHRLLETSVLAMVADHGENLGEHDLLHRHVGLWDTTTHVPMLIRYPGPPLGEGPRRGRRFEGLVQTIDLFPTLLRAAALEAPPSDGIDLEDLTASDRGGRRAVFSEHANHMGLSVRTDRWRLVRSAGNPHLEDGLHLYDLEADPGENRNRAGTGEAVEEQLSALLDRWLADRRAAPDASSRELTPKEVEQLKALGYL